MKKVLFSSIIVLFLLLIGLVFKVVPSKALEGPVIDNVMVYGDESDPTLIRVDWATDLPTTGLVEYGN